MYEISNELKKDYLDRLDKIKVSFLKNYSIKQMLFNESQYVLVKEQDDLIKVSIKNAILSIFSIRKKISISNNGAKILTITEIYNRLDHDKYWKKIKDLFEDKDEIVIDIYKSRKEQRKNIKIKSIIPNLVLFIRLILAFGVYTNFAHRIYLASQCLEQCVVLKKVEQYGFRPKIEMCFFDGGFYENILVQYFKSIGTKTITNQHGQPVYRGNYLDLVDQSQILNFKSDFFLAKGEMTKKQFELAGLNSNKILIVGDMDSNIDISIKQDQTYTFCVFLDCVTFEFAERDNKIMILMAKEFSSKTNYKYYIKIHPTDSIDKYRDIDDLNCLGLLDKSVRLQDISSKVDFSISNCSAIYIDMLKLGIKPFKLQTKTFFPIVNNSNDIIHSILELEDRLKEWIGKSMEEKKQYFNAEYAFFSSTENTKDRIKDFVYNLEVL